MKNPVVVPAGEMSKNELLAVLKLSYDAGMMDVNEWPRGRVGREPIEVPAARVASPNAYEPKMPLKRIRAGGSGGLG